MAQESWSRAVLMLVLGLPLMAIVPSVSIAESAEATNASGSVAVAADDETLAADGNGILGLAFGSQIDALKRKHATAELLPEGKNIGAATVDSPYISRFVVRGATVHGHPEPVDVELRYWSQQLWLAVVYLGDHDLEESSVRLDSIFGKRQKGRISSTWTKDAVDVVLSHQRKWYSVADKGLNKQAAEAVRAQLQKILKERIEAGRKKIDAASKRPADQSRTSEDQ